MSRVFTGQLAFSDLGSIAQALQPGVEVCQAEGPFMVKMVTGSRAYQSQAPPSH